MDDSNIPFTTGELWLAAPTEQSTTLLNQQVDARRGFPPIWTPDGRQLAFTAQDSIWIVEQSQAPIQVSPPTQWRATRFGC